MDKVRIGVLSQAHGHANVYCRVMQDFDDVELVATWDDNVTRGQEAAQNCGLEFRANADDVINELLADPMIGKVCGSAKVALGDRLLFKEIGVIFLQVTNIHCENITLN